MVNAQRRALHLAGGSVRGRGAAVRALALALLLVSARGRSAAAQSLSLDAIPARAVARAGAGLLSDDLGGAWAHNPAAASRRTQPRVLLGVTLVDTDLELSPFTSEPAPHMVSRAGVGRAPVAAASISWGRTTFGLTVLSAQRVARRFEGPPPSVDLADVQRAFSMRYAGLSGALRREMVLGGVSRRFSDQLALGVSAGAARVSMRESRHVWAGVVPRDEVGDPRHDLELVVSGVDPVVPMASAGLVYVPDEGAVELGLGVSYVGPTTLSGSITPSPTDVNSPVVTGDPSAVIELPHTMVLRSGVRWQGERWSAEGSGQLELWPARARALTWQMSGVSVVDASNLSVRYPELPSQLSLRSTASLRGAVDVEVVEGLLWLVAGAAWAPLGTSVPRLSPGFGESGGVTLAAGAEVSAGGVTISLGLSRLWAPPRSVRQSLRGLDGPFPGGDAGTGFARYQPATDLVGFAVEVEQL